MLHACMVNSTMLLVQSVQLVLPVWCFVSPPVAVAFDSTNIFFLGAAVITFAT